MLHASAVLVYLRLLLVSCFCWQPVSIPWCAQALSNADIARSHADDCLYTLIVTSAQRLCCICRLTWSVDANARTERESFGPKKTKLTRKDLLVAIPSSSDRCVCTVTLAMLSEAEGNRVHGAAATGLPQSLIPMCLSTWQQTPPQGLPGKLYFENACRPWLISSTRRELASTAFIVMSIPS